MNRFLNLAFKNLALKNLALATLALTFAACGGQTRRMELRSSEQLQISQLLGCTDYDIEETNSREGTASRRYSASCDGTNPRNIVCTDGGSCQFE